VARRIDATAYIDVFSYLSPETRHAVAARLSPARVTFDAARRTHAEELQVGVRGWVVWGAGGGG
jgi:hypothetical protein